MTLLLTSMTMSSLNILSYNLLSICIFSFDYCQDRSDLKNDGSSCKIKNNSRCHLKLNLKYLLMSLYYLTGLINSK